MTHKTVVFIHMAIRDVGRNRDKEKKKKTTL